MDDDDLPTQLDEDRRFELTRTVDAAPSGRDAPPPGRDAPPPGRELTKTVALGPSAPPRAQRPSAPPSSLDHARPSALRTAMPLEEDLDPLSALQRDEIQRLRSTYWVMVAGVAGMLAILPLLDGDPHLRLVVIAGLVAYAAAGTWLRWKVATPGGYTDTNLLLAAVPGIIAGVAAIDFWGIFSPAPAVVAVVLYMTSLQGSLRAALPIYLLFALAQLTLAALQLAGITDDPGLIHARYAPPVVQLTTQAVIQFILFAAFGCARVARRSTLDAMARLESAARYLARRDALLDEARLELERADRHGRIGRYSDRQVGEFKLAEVIGRGAMGEVYEAERISDGRPAAVKLLHPDLVHDHEVYLRFEREVRVAAAIASPNVVTVLGFGDASAEVPFLAMERLRGDDLATVLRRRPRLDPAAAADLVSQVARGLEAARQAGVIHRDLKPHNLFADQQSGRTTWKILDFGVSTLAESEGTLTHGRAVGTPAYMSPEQARGEPVDHRADVYALGAIAYRALTGQPPFPGRDIAVVIHDVIYKMPPRPSELAELAPDFDAVLAIALGKRRDVRFATALELAEAFDAARRGVLPAELVRRAHQILLQSPWGATLPAS